LGALWLAVGAAFAVSTGPRGIGLVLEESVEAASLAAPDAGTAPAVVASDKTDEIVASSSEERSRETAPVEIGAAKDAVSPERAASAPRATERERARRSAPSRTRRPQARARGGGRGPVPPTALASASESMPG